MDSEKQIQELKDRIDKAKATRYRAEARLEELQKQRQQYLDELDRLEVKPENLDHEIEKLGSQIRELIEKAKDLIPNDL